MVERYKKGDPMPRLSSAFIQLIAVELFFFLAFALWMLGRS